MAVSRFLQAAQQHRTEVYGHRGQGPHGAKPANSILALEHSLKTADGVELDLRLSKDGEIWLNHDPEVHAADGRKIPVTQTLSADLATLKLKGADGTIAPLARLSDFFDVLCRPEYASKKAVLEFKKPPKGVASKDAYRRALAQAAAAQICERGLEDRVVVSSFDPKTLRELQSLLPEVTRYLLTSSAKPLKLQIAQAKGVDLAGIHAGVSKAFGHFFAPSDRTLQRLDRDYGSLGTWSTESVASAARQARDGVDVLITDEPERIRRALDKLGG